MPCALSLSLSAERSFKSQGSWGTEGHKIFKKHKDPWYVMLIFNDECIVGFSVCIKDVMRVVIFDGAFTEALACAIHSAY